MYYLISQNVIISWLYTLKLYKNSTKPCIFTYLQITNIWIFLLIRCQFLQKYLNFSIKPYFLLFLVQYLCYSLSAVPLMMLMMMVVYCMLHSLEFEFFLLAIVLHSLAQQLLNILNNLQINTQYQKKTKFCHTTT